MVSVGPFSGSLGNLQRERGWCMCVGIFFIVILLRHSCSSQESTAIGVVVLDCTKVQEARGRQCMLPCAELIFLPSPPGFYYANL